MVKPASRKRVPIVAIGASAGGIEALQTLFQALPQSPRAAFVVLVHLSPDHSSALPEIIQRHCEMRVKAVTARTLIEENTVYVISPNRQLLVSADHIASEPMDPKQIPRAPVDHFFRSMARDHGDGFAIILTGGGGDGALGVKAVKEGGGIILVQDPAEAEYPSMPNSAIASGVADFVLTIADIAARLPALIEAKNKVILDDLPPAEEDLLRKVLAHLKSKTGNDFSQYKRATVGRRLARRMQVVRAHSLSDYLGNLQTDPDEVRLLLADLLISVTSFFRDTDAFQSLANVALAEILKRREDGSDGVRVWVPGCATGEEVYSLAILLLEQCTLEPRPDIQIFASDLDPAALAAAREGRYPLSIANDVGERRLRRFFTRDGDHYRIKQEVRDLIVFAHHSVLRDPPFSHIDLVSCRNLLIYLDRPLQNQVCATFHYALRGDGYLFLGSSESIEGQSLFRTIDRDARIFQAIGRPRSVPSLPNLFAGARLSEPLLPATLPREIRPNYMTDHKQALEQLAPPSLLLDESHRILNHSENVGRYLLAPGGPPTVFATDLVRPELRLDLQASLHRAFDQGEASLTLPVGVRFNGHAHEVSLCVKPLQRDGSSKTALVMFLEGGVATPPADVSYDSDGNNSFLVTQLRNELSTTQAHLRTSRSQYEAVTEELRASNEELQSINEEYRSTSEELETSKEELQSINEELQTLNNELKLKLDIVSRANNDLQNLMSATDVATLFLTTELRINRFTPKVSDIFHVTPGDEGRPLSDFTSKLEGHQVVDDAANVLQHLTPIERNLKSNDGRWFLMRVRLYRTLDDKIDGTVITFVDITQQREAERLWEEKQKLLMAELSHRVKNVLSVVQAVVLQTLKSSNVDKVVSLKIQERLGAIAASHDLLLAKDWKGAILADIISSQLTPYLKSDLPRVVLRGPELFLPPDIGSSVGLVIHELGTNAAKYGALSSPAGRVDVDWSIVDDGMTKTLRLLWRETGGPEVKEGRSGFGSRLIDTCIRDATVTRTFNRDGLRCDVVFPLQY